MKHNLGLRCIKCGFAKTYVLEDVKYTRADLMREVRPKLRGFVLRCPKCFGARWALLAIHSTLEIEIRHIVGKFQADILNIFGKYGE